MKRSLLLFLGATLAVAFFPGITQAAMDKKEAIHLKEESLRHNRLDLYDLRTGAHGGDLWAENEYGVFLVQSGKDSGRGFVWIRKAAQHNLTVAQRNVGSFYARGIVVPKNYALAAKWFRPAAVAGDAKAQYYLGILYLRGWGVPKDPARALKWFRKSALQNDPAPAYQIGLLYDKGQGVERNAAKAIKWFREAAIKNYAPAEKALATAYAHGDGVPKDPALAQKWFKKANLVQNGVGEFLIHWEID